MEKEIIIIDPYENKLNTYVWTPENREPVGIVQIIHGASEHMGRYREFAEYLNSLDLIVIGNDHLGHGKTDPEAEYVFFSEDIGFHKVYEGVKSVRDYIEETYPKLDVIMFAHAMGSYIGRYTILYDYKRYDQAIFSGTGWVDDLKIYMALALLNITILFKKGKYFSPYLSRLLTDGPYRSMKKNGIINKKIEWISADVNIQREYTDDPLCGKPFTVGALRDLYRFLPEIQDRKKIKESASATAIFFISGETDAAGEYGTVAKKLYKIYHNCGYSNVKYFLINNGRHEVINDYDRDHVHRLIGNWILKNL
ncbi:MAG: alpha/beta hydrolase [Bacilli bacterium]|nr:alpha/beta hydrolase [Bacilli bacterium]